MEMWLSQSRRTLSGVGRLTFSTFKTELLPIGLDDIS